MSTPLDLPAVLSLLSPHMRRAFLLPTDGFVAVLFGTVLGSLVIASTVLIFQLIDEIRKHAEDDRERLRYVETEQPVLAPPLGSGSAGPS